MTRFKQQHSPLQLLGTSPLSPPGVCMTSTKHMLSMRARVSQGMKSRHTHSVLTGRTSKCSQIVSVFLQLQWTRVSSEQLVVHRGARRRIRRVRTSAVSLRAQVASQADAQGSFSFSKICLDFAPRDQLSWSHISLCLCPGRLPRSSPLCTWGRCARWVSGRTEWPCRRLPRSPSASCFS